jgi:thiol-disulfide isomerase/thioredoxin
MRTALVLAHVAATGCASLSAKRRVPDFTGTARDGSLFLLSDYVHTSYAEPPEDGGKDVLITVFSTWCAPCRAELPQLVDYQREYVDDVQVVLFAIPSDNVREELDQLLPPHETPSPVILDQDRSIVKTIFGERAFRLPSSFLVGKSGKIVAYLRGFRPGVSLQRQIFMARRHRR